MTGCGGVTVAPGAEYRPLLAATLRGHLAYDVERYPNFDLDWNGIGCRLELEQELRLDGSASLVCTQRRRNFMERTLFADTAGTPSSRRRWEWRLGRARAGYAWSDIRSNGDRFDWGPDRSEAVNTVAGDERLIGDHFTRSSHGPFVGVGTRLPGRVQIDIDHRWALTHYPGRPAKTRPRISSPAAGRGATGGVSCRWRRPGCSGCGNSSSA